MVSKRVIQVLHMRLTTQRIADTVATLVVSNEDFSE